MQLLILFIMKTTLWQCENLTDTILSQKLGISIETVHDLIKILHDEHIVQYKYSFICPKCNETGTIEEDEIEKNIFCNFCGCVLDVETICQSATIRYMLDKDSFFEYVRENYRKELSTVEKGQEISSRKVIDFRSNKNEKLKGEQIVEKKKNRLFISHSSKDVEYIRTFIEFFESIGMSTESIFCSSVEGYKIKWGEDIFDYLSSEFNNDENNLIVLFMLSDNYYSSVACLNEMGATWVLKKEYRSILLPGFEFKKIEGAINPNKIAIKLDKEKDMRYSLTDVRKQMAEWFDLENIEEQRWDRIRDKFIESVEKIRAEQEK